SRLHELLCATHRGLLGPAPDPGRLAELDLLATRAWLKCAAHLFTGRVDPGALPADWHLKPRRTDLVARLEGALKRDRVGAVLRFQRRHGLDTTGVISAADVKALAVPPAEWVRRITLNLERWRWLPETLGERYVLVNIPEFMLRVVDHGRTALAMRVVVGKQFTP